MSRVRSYGSVLYWMPERGDGEIRRDGSGPDVLFRSATPFAQGDRVTFDAEPRGRQAFHVQHATSRPPAAEPILALLRRLPAEELRAAVCGLVEMAVRAGGAVVADDLRREIDAALR